MKWGKGYLLTAVLGLALACPAGAQNPNGQPPPGDSGLFNPQAQPPPPAFCANPNETQRNIVYPFAAGTDSFRPIGNAFFDPRYPLVGPPGGGAVLSDDTAFVEPVVSNYYVGLGLVAMRRTTLAREVVAELAPPLSYTYPFPVNLQAVPMPFLLGPRAEVGINFGVGVLELSGWYLFQQSTSYSQQGYYNPLLFSPLFNSQANFANYPAPAGFNPALWTTTNAFYQVTVNYNLAVGSAELNYRMPVLEYLVLLVGLRYFDINEHIDIATENAVGSTDYADGTRSRIVGPQIGFEFELPIIRGVSIEMNGKAAGGANFFYVVHTLTQSNGPAGPSNDNNAVQASGVFEGGAFINLWFTEHFRLHAGYQVLYATNVPEAQSQINFNTNVGTGTGEYHGNYFFQGPVFDLMWTF